MEKSDEYCKNCGASKDKRIEVKCPVFNPFSTNVDDTRMRYSYTHYYCGVCNQQNPKYVKR